MRSIADTIATYLAAARTRDAAERAALLARCFAAHGRIVSRSATFRGRDGVAAMLARFWADPQWRDLRIVSPIDTGATTFRFVAVAEALDGTLAESHDTGEVDPADDHRITTIYTFAGPLGRT